MDMAKGTLEELLLALPGGKMSERHACMYGWKLAEALRHLHHTLKVMHRDLNEKNVLVGEDGWFVVSGGWALTQGVPSSGWAHLPMPTLLPL